MLLAVIFHVAVMWIERIRIEFNLRAGLTRVQPRFLHVVCVNVGDSFLPARKFPVIAIAANCADDLRFRNVFDCLLEVCSKPILRSHRTGSAGDLMLVIVHHDQAIGSSGERRVIVVFICNRDVHVEPEPSRMQVLAQFLDQRQKSGLRFERNFLKIDCRTLELVTASGTTAAVCEKSAAPPDPSENRQRS